MAGNGESDILISNCTCQTDITSRLNANIGFCEKHREMGTGNMGISFLEAGALYKRAPACRKDFPKNIFLTLLSLTEGYWALTYGMSKNLIHDLSNSSVRGERALREVSCLGARVCEFVLGGREGRNWFKLWR